jgi:hypothetical protein
VTQALPITRDGGVLRVGWRTTLNTNCPLGQKGSRHG